MKKINLLVTTSSFFRNKEEDIFGGGNFVFQLSKRLIDDFNVNILAPSSDISVDKQELEGTKIYRHKQFFFKSIDLAFGPGILTNIQNNKLLVFALPVYVIYQLKKVIEICRTENIKIIHSHWIFPQGIIAVIYKLLFNKNIKLLLTIHGSDFNALNNSFFKMLKSFVINNSDSITVVSNDLLTKLQTSYPKAKIFLIPMGIDSKLFQIKEKNNILLEKYGTNYTYLIFIGALNENKSIIELIDAMQLVVNKNSNIKLLVIGNGNLSIIVKDKILKNNLCNNIELLGWIENKKIPEYLSICNFLILPSKSEGFGLVVAEAIACGVKVIVSNLNNFNDLINSENSLVLDEISKESIAMNILKYFDCVLNSDQKQFQRKIIIDKYSWEVIANKYNNLIKEI